MATNNNTSLQPSGTNMMAIAGLALSPNSIKLTSLWRPRQTRDVPFSPNSITPTIQKLPQRGKFPGSWRNGIWAKGDVTGLSQTCCGHHGEVGIVEFWLYTMDLASCHPVNSEEVKNNHGIQKQNKHKMKQTVNLRCADEWNQDTVTLPSRWFAGRSTEVQ